MLQLGEDKRGVMECVEAEGLLLGVESSDKLRVLLGIKAVVDGRMKAGAP